MVDQERRTIERFKVVLNEVARYIIVETCEVRGEKAEMLMTEDVKA